MDHRVAHRNWDRNIHCIPSRHCCSIVAFKNILILFRTQVFFSFVYTPKSKRLAPLAVGRLCHLLPPRQCRHFRSFHRHWHLTAPADAPDPFAAARSWSFSCYAKYKICFNKKQTMPFLSCNGYSINGIDSIKVSKTKLHFTKLRRLRIKYDVISCEIWNELQTGLFIKKIVLDVINHLLKQCVLYRFQDFSLTNPCHVLFIYYWSAVYGEI